jgi:hypothetical protein
VLATFVVADPFLPAPIYFPSNCSGLNVAWRNAGGRECTDLSAASTIVPDTVPISCHVPQLQSSRFVQRAPRGS